MIPKTLGAIAVENTGEPRITTAQVENGLGSSDEGTTPDPGAPPPVLDVRGDAASKRPPPLPTKPAMPQQQGSGRRTNG